MSWIHFSWSWIIEPAVLFFIVALLIKMVASNSKKIDVFTQQMCTSIDKAQSFLQHVDHEFNVMNDCAKSVKSVFLNFSRVYKDISEGTKTVDEAVREARNSLPEELRKNLSNPITISERNSESSIATDARHQIAPHYDSSLEFEYSKAKSYIDELSHDSGAIDLSLALGKKSEDEDDVDSKKSPSLPESLKNAHNFTEAECEVKT